MAKKMKLSEQILALVNKAKATKKVPAKGLFVGRIDGYTAPMPKATRKKTVKKAAAPKAAKKVAVKKSERREKSKR